jgi:glycine oxidase
MPDFIIIGGGLIGMLTARELAIAGHSVTLMEQGMTGRESSWAGGGIISPLYPWRYAASITHLASWGQRHYPDLALALTEESGVDPEYTRNGLLVLEPEDSLSALQWRDRTPQAVKQLDAQSITACEPALKADSGSAIWLPEVAQIRNPRLVKAVRGAIEERVEILEQTPVTQLVTHKGSVVGVETTRGRRSAAITIICAGAWSGKLLQPYIPAPRIEPVLGQMIILRTQRDAIRRIVLHQERYLIPRRDGRILVGSTLEYRGFEKQITGSARESLSRYARDRFPLLQDAQIEHHWAGLRPGSPQGIPYIGPVPGVEGLFINAGHFRNGVVLGPASARLLADLVLEHEPILPAAPYAVDAQRE